MSAFYDGQYDVLLSTTIVESGLDIPTANTLIMHPGRHVRPGPDVSSCVAGSGGLEGARLCLPDYAGIDRSRSRSRPRRRLKVLQSLDSLGAGFQLASHDLDIRGGGNLLGEEQSGHIREIGVELYQQMLEDAVNELKAQRRDRRRRDLDRGWSPADQYRGRSPDPRRLRARPERAALALPPHLRGREVPGPRGLGRRTDRPVRPAAAARRISF